MFYVPTHGALFPQKRADAVGRRRAKELGFGAVAKPASWSGEGLELSLRG